MIKYVNSKGQEFSLSASATVLIKETNLHEKVWDYDSTSKKYGVKITQFKKDPIEIPMILRFKGKRAEIVKNLNAFFELTEYDILVNSAGKLYFNDWYLECFVLEDTTEPDEESHGVEKEIKVVAPYPFWIRETKSTITIDIGETIVESGSIELESSYLSELYEVSDLFRVTNFSDVEEAANKYWLSYSLLAEDGSTIQGFTPLKEEVETSGSKYIQFIYTNTGTCKINYEMIKKSSNAKEFPYDFPYDLLSNSIVAQIINRGLTEQEAQIIIYGPATSPEITIGDNSYAVNCTVEEGDILTIDTKAKTIILRRADGTEENMFSLREPRTDFFRKIAVGSNPILWDGSFGMDVILFEERSTPEWI